MAKQQVLQPSRHTTLLATLGLAALVAALLGIAWTISNRMYAPVTGSATSVSAPAAPLSNSAPTNRFFADEVSGASAQYGDAATVTHTLLERLQNLRQTAAPVSAPVVPASQVRISNRFFADEVAGASAQYGDAAALTHTLPERLQDAPQTAALVAAPVASAANTAAANRFFADEVAGASAQYRDAAALTHTLPERLQDVRRPAALVSAPAVPASQVRISNRFFADEVFGSGGVVLQTDSALLYITPLSGPR